LLHAGIIPIYKKGVFPEKNTFQMAVWHNLAKKTGFTAVKQRV
jgi:hypothetical protein